MTVAYIDGGCRGHRLAAYGVYIRHQGQIVELAQVLTKPATNNMAEYCGLIAVLRWARGYKVNPLLVRSDSQLIVYQMQGRYQVHDKKLIPLYREAYLLTQDVGVVTVEWVPREQNREADRLCNEAMDAAANAPRLTKWRNLPRFLPIN